MDRVEGGQEDIKLITWVRGWQQRGVGSRVLSKLEYYQRGWRSTVEGGDNWKSVRLIEGTKLKGGNNWKRGWCKAVGWSSVK